ncbi:MAG: redoxin domain-containing protein [Anaerolineales bacterium]|nr:redoxin domain-containing protein [Anaerolineales bacterium]
MAEVEKPAAEPMAEAEQAAVATEESMAKVEEAAAEEVMAEAAEPSGEMAETAPVEGEMMAQETLAEAGPTEAQVQLLAGLKNQGMPPELFNQVWLNSDPLKLADLHGKVVIVEFWTFGCYNCKNVVPSLRAWHHSYSDEGLVIIGVHTPEFGFERELENVEQALIDQDIPYAVALDNDWQTWRAYNNRYWPAKYFIDKAGNLRHVAIGEGRYDEQEEIIKALLAERVVG